MQHPFISQSSKLREHDEENASDQHKRKAGTSDISASNAFEKSQQWQRFNQTTESE